MDQGGALDPSRRQLGTADEKIQQSLQFRHFRSVVLTEPVMCISGSLLISAEFIMLVDERGAVVKPLLLLLQDDFMFVLANVSFLLVNQRTMLLKPYVILVNGSLNLR